MVILDNLNNGVVIHCQHNVHYMAHFKAAYSHIHITHKWQCDCFGSLDEKIKLIVLVYWTLWSFPCANQPSLLLSLRNQKCLLGTMMTEMIVSFFFCGYKCDLFGIWKGVDLPDDLLHTLWKIARFLHWTGVVDCHWIRLLFWLNFYVLEYYCSELSVWLTMV